MGASERNGGTTGGISYEVASSQWSRWTRAPLEGTAPARETSEEGGRSARGGRWWAGNVLARNLRTRPPRLVPALSGVRADNGGQGPARVRASVGSRAVERLLGGWLGDAGHAVVRPREREEECARRGESVRANHRPAGAGLRRNRYMAPPGRRPAPVRACPVEVVLDSLYADRRGRAESPPVAHPRVQPGLARGPGGYRVRTSSRPTAAPARRMDRSVGRASIEVGVAI